MRIVPHPDWSPLDDALQRAADKGCAIAFWWRDDDAVAHTPALDRLLALAASLRVPLVLAPIPARVEPSLAARLSDESWVGVTVHGLRHTNHAPPGKAKTEFGPNRSLDTLKADADSGLRAAQARFGVRLNPIFVPPWNRIAPALAAALPALGYCGRSLTDPDALVAKLVRSIDSRLSGAAYPEPIGVLTHHLAHDEAVWTFCEALLERLVAQPVARFPSIDAVFSIEARA
jgi:hypothetical protein